MPTVKLVSEDDPDPIVQRVFRDIKATKRNRLHPKYLASVWRRIRSIWNCVGRG